jgi:hypothetical protein
LAVPPIVRTRVWVAKLLVAAKIIARNKIIVFFITLVLVCVTTAQIFFSSQKTCAVRRMINVLSSTLPEHHLLPDKSSQPININVLSAFRSKYKVKIFTYFDILRQQKSKSPIMIKILIETGKRKMN